MKETWLIFTLEENHRVEEEEEEWRNNNLESIGEITWYDRRYDTAVTNAVGKPQSHGLAHCSAQSGANLEHGDENSRWNGNSGAYDREDELEAKFSLFPSFENIFFLFIFTVNATKPIKPMNTSVYTVDQCFTMFISSTPNSCLVQVKLVNKPYT